MNKYRVSKEDVPPETKAKGLTLTLGELRDTVKRLPEAQWAAFAYSDGGGFESCLSAKRIYYCEGILWITIQSDCTPYYVIDEQPYRPETIKFRHHKIENEILMRRKPIGEWLKQLDKYPDETPICMANQVNFSKYGKHYIMPLTSVGPQVWASLSNNEKAYFVDRNILDFYCRLRDKVEWNRLVGACNLDNHF